MNITFTPRSIRQFFTDIGNNHVSINTLGCVTDSILLLVPSEWRRSSAWSCGRGCCCSGSTPHTGSSAGLPARCGTLTGSPGRWTSPGGAPASPPPPTAWWQHHTQKTRLGNFKIRWAILHSDSLVGEDWSPREWKAISSVRVNVSSLKYSGESSA